METKTELQGRGAIYFRVSTDQQDEQRQRTTVHDFLARNGIVPENVATFEDHGWSRHEADKRPEFQRLLTAVEAGRIQWIAVDALDRFGTKSKDQLVHYRYRLQEAGCKLFDCSGR